MYYPLCEYYSRPAYNNVAMKAIRNIVLIGDVLYILWIVYNGIDEGFRNIGSVQAIALIGLIILLALNITLLSKSR